MDIWGPKVYTISWIYDNNAYNDNNNDYNNNDRSNENDNAYQRQYSVCKLYIHISGECTELPFLSIYPYVHCFNMFRRDKHTCLIWAVLTDDGTDLIPSASQNPPELLCQGPSPFPQAHGEMARLEMLVGMLHISWTCHQTLPRC